MLKKRKSADEIARNMGAIRSTGGKTETLLRSALHGMGLRFRKNAHNLPGKPDIVFPSARVVVFVDGDYWHGRALREQGEAYLRKHFADDQRGYWSEKLNRNVRRDEQVTAELAGQGWKVLRFWESDVRNNIQHTAQEIAKTVHKQRASRNSYPR